jgi:predicted aspartyl protease
MTDFTPGRRTLLAGGLALALTGRAAAQAPDKTVNDKADNLTTLDGWVDAFGRPTAKVMLNGRGPFDFLVDTGANLTVITKRRAQELGVIPSGTTTINGTTGSAELPVAILARLATGVVDAADLRVAVLPDALLPHQDGVLGADMFVDRRLVFEIPQKRVRVEQSHRSMAIAPHLAGVGSLRVRNGRLAEIDGRIGRLGARLMLDTGAAVCIANHSLGAALLKAYPRTWHANKAAVRGVNGRTITGDLLMLPDLSFGGLIVRDAIAVAADAPIFDLWQLSSAPAMIVGVNVLSRMASFAIDYGAGQFEAQPLASALDGALQLS